MAQSDTPAGWWPLWRTVPAWYTLYPVVTIAMLINTFQLIWETVTLYKQHNGIAANLTHNEMVNGDKYHYFKTITGDLYNPFSQGYSANFKNFFCGDGIDYTRYYWVDGTRNV